MHPLRALRSQPSLHGWIYEGTLQQGLQGRVSTYSLKVFLVATSSNRDVSPGGSFEKTDISSIIKKEGDSGQTQ